MSTIVHIVRVEGRFKPRNWLARFVLWPMAKPMRRGLTRRVLGELDAFVTAPEQPVATA